MTADADSPLSGVAGRVPPKADPPGVPPKADPPADDRAWTAYLEVRDIVRRMRSVPAGGVASPSAYWTEELGHIDYMAEASPLIIRKLRHHAFWITGLRAYDYRVQDDERRDLFEGRLRALVEIGGADLPVPEPETLGGFGYRIDGKLYNLDTLKFLEVLVGLRRAGILDALRSSARETVIEIGAGWGGLAHQIKTLAPGVTYVIVDFPELFLFSAVYLRTQFPHATMAFVESGTGRWPEADFIFVPNTLAGAIASAPAASLVVNVASFQEMTAAQVDFYARTAAHARCRALYSLNRDRSRYNHEIDSVPAVLARYYDLRELQILDTDYTKAMKKPARSKKKAEDAQVRPTPAMVDADLSYRHLAGTLRALG